MKKRILVLNLVLALFALVSCSSNDDNSIPTPVESTSQFTIPTDKQFRAFQIKELKKLEQNLSGTTDNTSMITFTSNNGVMMKTNHLTYIENDVVKKVQKGDTPQLKFVEIYNRGQMILTNRTTVAAHVYHENSFESKAQFASGGQFYMDMQVNNTSVKDFTIIMFVPTKNSTNKQTDMTLWLGDLNNVNDIVYSEVPSESTMHNINVMKLNNTEYYTANLWRIDNSIFFTPHIGWVGIHKMKPVSAAKASVSVKAPSGYNMSNSAVYVLNKNDEGVTQLKNYFSEQKDDDIFSSINNYLPVGDDVTLLFMSIDPKTSAVIYALKELKLEQNQLLTFDVKDLKQANTDEFVKLVNKI